jgi:hypothetical protein
MLELMSPKATNEKKMNPQNSYSVVGETQLSLRDQVLIGLRNLLRTVLGNV